MKYLLVCTKCNCQVWIRGFEEPDVNVITTDDNDRNWSEACEHIQAGDYNIEDRESVFDLEDPCEVER